MLGSQALSSFFSSIGKTRIVMTANISGMLINIPLNALLIFGIPEGKILAFKGLGMAGAAYASNISTVLIFAILALKFFSGYYKKHFNTAYEYRIDYIVIKKLFAFGGPAGVELFLNVTAFNVFIFVIGSIGVIEQAAVNIAFSWNLLAFLPLIGLAIATTALVGKNMGAVYIQGANDAVYSSLIIGYAYIIALSCLYLIMPEKLVSIFCPPGAENFQEISVISGMLLRYIVIYIFFNVMLTVFSGALRGAGDTKFIMYVSVMVHWLLLTLPAFLLVYVFHTDIQYVWLVFILFSILLGLIYLLRFYYGPWREIRVI